MAASSTPDRKSAGGAPPYLANDPLRGIAAFGVFIGHAGYFAVIGAGYARLLVPDSTNRSMFGSVLAVPLRSVGTLVPIFFMLSAYLIARPFAATFVTGARPPNMLRFARRRFCRIAPVYWVTFTLILIGWGLQGASLSQTLGVYGFNANWAHSPFAGVYGQAWTMDVETRFYLAMFVIAVALIALRRPLRDHKRMRVMTLVLIAVVIWVWSIVDYAHTPSSLALTLPSMMWALAPGLLFAALEPILINRIPDTALVRFLLAGVFAVGMILLLAFTGLPAQLGSPFKFIGPYAPGRIYQTLGETAVVGSTLLYQWSTGGCWRILDNRPLRWLGSRSYSFYLLHFVILMQLSRDLHGIGGYTIEMVVLVPLAFAVTGLAAELMYRAVEGPTTRYGQQAGRARVKRATRIESAEGRLEPAAAKLEPALAKPEL